MCHESSPCACHCVQVEALSMLGLRGWFMVVLGHSFQHRECSLQSCCSDWTCSSLLLHVQSCLASAGGCQLLCPLILLLRVCSYCMALPQDRLLLLPTCTLKAPLKLLNFCRAKFWQIFFSSPLACSYFAPVWIDLDLTQSTPLSNALLPQDLDGTNLDAAMAQHLLVAADRFALPRLRRICERRLCETVEVRPAQASTCPPTHARTRTRMRTHARRCAFLPWLTARTLRWILFSWSAYPMLWLLT